MEPYPFVDALGRGWHVYDYRVVGVGHDAKKRAVPVGHYSAEARAFVPIGRDAPVLVYAFNVTPYRDTNARTLEGQLRFAKPLNASAAVRMMGHS